MGCSPSTMATTSPESCDRSNHSYNDLKKSKELSEPLAHKETDSSVEPQKQESPSDKQADSRVEKQENPDHTEVKAELVANDDLKKTKEPPADTQTDPSVEPHKQSSLTVKQADLRVETKEKPKETEVKTETRDKVDVKPEEPVVIKDFDEFCKETFELVRQSAKILDADNISLSDMERLPDVEKEMMRMSTFYFAAQKCFERHDYERFQILFCDVVLDSNQLRLYENVLHEVPKTVDFDGLNTSHEKIFLLVMLILHNCTDLSDTFAETVSASTITVYIKQILDINSARYLKGELKVNE